MAHRATITDLADKAGVSVSTIDRILNGREKVRAATASRVLAAAEALNFYALPVLRERLKIDRPAIRLGFLLQQSHRTFYRMIAAALQAAAAESAEPVEVVIEHMDDLSPEAVAARLLDLGQKVHAVAVVTAEHARISHAIETLSAQGVPTYGLISELTSGCGTGYIGLDNWRVGRTAAWAIAGLCKRPGKVGILVGNHRYRCQELNESGFRSYCREHGAQFALLEPLQTFEDNAIAREVTEQLLAREPDLVGLYVCGGGMVGVLAALKAAGRSRSVVTVGHEITEHTRNGLIDDDLALVMAHPISRLATEAIAQMRRDIVTGAGQSNTGPSNTGLLNSGQSNTGLSKRMIGFEIYTPENI